jgi:hypothetical protein
MSHNDWESGEMRLPVAAFPSFRRELNEFHNQRQVQLLAKATEIFENRAFQAKVKELTKGQKSEIYSSTLEDAIMAHLRERVSLSGYYSYNPPTQPVDGADEIYFVLLPYKATKITRPMKKHFAPVKLTNNEFNLSGSSIIFDPKARSVNWSVAENNHACERAREHPLARKLFDMLHKVQWVRGTGGMIVGNDEHNRESTGVGGGANYSKGRFGPLGEPDVWVRRPARSSFSRKRLR